MEKPDGASALAASVRGVMQAAAGCGKTTLIAAAVARYRKGRQLVLTHTHAGVAALRCRLKEFGAPANAYRLETIAGWALRLASSFPRTAQIPNKYMPQGSEDYNLVYKGAAILARLTPVIEILKASYGGIYVDEYQDCTIEQHDFILALAETLPCRIVGDPLQGIYGFGNNSIVNWRRDVLEIFEKLPEPEIAWRWSEKNPELGKWLKYVRTQLQDGKGVDLKHAPICWLQPKNEDHKVELQIKECFRLKEKQGTVVAIHKLNNQCHYIASRLRGTYNCIEPIDISDLYISADFIDKEHGFSRANAVIAFAAKCATSINGGMHTVQRAFLDGRVPTVRKHKEQLDSLIKVINDDNPLDIIVALDLLKNIVGAHVYRKELFKEMKSALRALSQKEEPSLYEAAWHVRDRTRRMGRVNYRCVVGTTLLVKGLEFDHAIVLDAQGYNAENLYVALTRGSKTLTVISESQVLQPARSG